MNEFDYQEELRLIDGLDDIYFDEINKENVKKYFEAKEKIKKMIRRYQVLALRQGKAREIEAMREFEKYGDLGSKQIH